MQLREAPLCYYHLPLLVHQFLFDIHRVMQNLYYEPPLHGCNDYVNFLFSVQVHYTSYGHQLDLVFYQYDSQVVLLHLPFHQAHLYHHDKWRLYFLHLPQMLQIGSSNLQSFLAIDLLHLLSFLVESAFSVFQGLLK